MRDVHRVRHPDPSSLRPAPHRPHQWLVLRHAEPGSVRHLRPSQHHQLRPRRAVHDGRLRRLLPPPVGGARILVGPRGRAACRRPRRGGAGAHHAQAPLRSRSPLWAAAHFRPRPRDPGALPQPVRLLGTALPDPSRAHGREQPRLHGPAQLSRLGGRLLTRHVPGDVVRDRADQARLLSASGHGESRPRPGLRRQRASHDHVDVWLRGGVGRSRRRARRAHLPGQPAHGRRSHHRGLRGGGYRRHGVHRRLYRHWLRPGHRGGIDQGLLSRGVEHRDLRDHGPRSPRPTHWTLRAGKVVSVASQAAPGVEPATTSGVNRHQVTASAVMVLVLVAAPFFVYPLFLMKALCFALFACAFNLLIGYVGLLSFGHALFFGCASYVSAHAAKEWGFPPELAILSGAAAGAGLGLIVGALAIRRQGIYFAMITLALAQMMYFFAVQAPFTHGEDGIQAVPRGKLFGFIDLADQSNMYIMVLVIFLGCFLLIYRIINSPFGEVLKAIRENEPRAISLGYKSERYKLVAFVLSATFAGVAGATKALVFQLASLTDIG